jgi:hypothetical protein
VIRPTQVSCANLEDMPVGDPIQKLLAKLFPSKQKELLAVQLNSQSNLFVFHKDQPGVLP